MTHSTAQSNSQTITAKSKSSHKGETKHKVWTSAEHMTLEIDMTAEIVLPSNHKAQQSIFFKLFHGELNSKKNRLQGSMVQM